MWDQVPAYLVPFIDDLIGEDKIKILSYLNEKSLSDLGNADAFVSLHGSRVRFDHNAGRWLIFNGSVWCQDVDGQVHRLAIDCIRKRYLAASLISDDMKRQKIIAWALKSEDLYRKNALLDHAKNMLQIATTIDRFDLDPMLLGVKNGVIDLRIGRLLRGQPDHMVSKCCSCEFKPDAKCPRWEQFLGEIFSGDREIINFIQLAIGYSLTGLISEQVFFMLHGRGANGKSTFLETIKLMLSDYAATTQPTTFEASRFDGDRQTNDIAALKGTRFVTASEVREKSRFNEARLKSLTGGDTITARFLHREFFTYQPSFKVWLAVNHVPKVDDTSIAFWRRVHLIPFERQFLDHERDPHLKEKLIEEITGILSWAVAGCLAWQKEGLPIPTKIRAATDNYRNSSDIVVQFLKDCTIQGEDMQVEAGRIYDAFKKWCETNGESWMTGTMFGRRMREIGYERGKTSETRRYQYLKIGLLEGDR